MQRALQRYPRHGHNLGSLSMDCESTGCTREATAFPGERSQRQESLGFCRDGQEPAPIQQGVNLGPKLPSWHRVPL